MDTIEKEVGLLSVEQCILDGNLHGLRQLVERGCKLQEPDDKGKQPIQLAVEHEKLEIVEFLIDSGVDPCAADKNGILLIHSVSAMGNIEMAQLLFKRGCKIDVKDKKGTEPIHFASFSGNVQLVKFLYENGCRLDVANQAGFQPIHLAVCKGGGRMLIQGLIDRGFQIDICDQTVLEDLSLYSGDNKLEMIKFLLEHGCDQHAKDKEGHQPVHFLSSTAHTDVMDFVLEHGCEIDVSDLNGCHPIHFCVEGGNLEMMKCLIKRGADLHAKNKFGVQPIHFAARSDNIEMMKFMLENGCKIDEPDQNEQYPIHWSAERGKFEMLKFLSKLGGHLRARDKSGVQPIHLGACTDNIEMMEFMLENGCKIDEPDQNGRFQIHWSAEKGKLEMLKFLFKHGCHLRAVDKSGTQPIHLAATTDNIEMMEFMLDNGCKIDESNQSGRYPIHWSASYGKLEMLKFLMEHGSDLHALDKSRVQPIHLAAITDNIEMVEFMLKNGCKIDEPDQSGRYPIHWSANYGKLEMLNFLMEHGSDLHALDKSRVQPIHLAACTDNIEMMEFMLENGCKIDEPDRDGRHPIHWSANKGKLEMLKFLFKQGRDLRAVDKSGVQPIHLAATTDNIEMMEFMLENGCKIDEPDQDGRYPIHRSAGKGKFEMLKFLFKQGSDLRAVDKSGLQPIHLAATTDNIEMMKFMLENGCKIDEPDQSGRYPIHFSAQSGKLEMLKFLIEHGSDLHALDKSRVQPIHLAACTDNIEMMKFMLENGCKINEPDQYGSQPIHYAATTDNIEMMEFMLDNGCKIDESNQFGRKPIDYAQSQNMKRVLRQHQKQQDYQVLMKEPAVKLERCKLFICGHGGVGKTTLVKSLQKITPIDPTDYDPTPGIDQRIVDIPTAGMFCVVDLAGQPQYYVTHSMFMRAEHSIFAVVYKTSKIVNNKPLQPMDVFGESKEQVSMWLRFIKATNPCTSDLPNAKPTVILVASRADILPPQYQEQATFTMSKMIEEARNMFGRYINIVDKPFLLDCRASQHDDMQTLRNCLRQYKRQDMIPNLCAKIISHKKHMIRNPRFPTISWDNYTKEVKGIDTLLEEMLEEDLLTTATHYIHDMGEVVYMKGRAKGRDVVVLEPQWLFNRVFGPMLATEIFRQYSMKLDDLNKCIYSKADINDVLSAHSDVNLLIHLLEEFELLFPTKANYSSTDDRQMYIIPGLLKEDMPSSGWQRSVVQQMYYGRRVQCHDDTDSFTAGFFPRLQTRLHNHLTEVGRPPSHVWKNGMKFSYDVEGLVYLTDDRRAVHVCVRAEKDAEIGQCHQLLQRICKDVDDLLETACPGVSVDQFVLSPESLREHSEPEDVRYYPMEDIYEAEERGRKVYDKKIGKEESITKLLCQGYDDTFVKMHGYHCDVKWMMQPYREHFVRSMDRYIIGVGVCGHMAQFMGIGNRDFMKFEDTAKGLEKSVAELVLTEWSDRWAPKKPSYLPTEDTELFRTRSSSAQRTPSLLRKPSNTVEQRRSMLTTGGSGRPVTKGKPADLDSRAVFMESSFANLIEIMRLMGRHDCMCVIDEMFSKVGMGAVDVPSSESDEADDEA